MRAWLISSEIRKPVIPGIRLKPFEKWVLAYRLKFSGRAVCEIGEAFEWYEEPSLGLGTEFELAFELQLKRPEQLLFMYAEVMPGVRRTLPPRFPYGFFTLSKMIWFTYWLSFTTYATRNGGPVNASVKWTFRRTLLINKSRRLAVDPNCPSRSLS